MGDEIKTVEPGGSYRMEVEADTTAEPASGGGPFHTARNHFVWVAIIGISAATAIGVWRALVSDCNP
jgi:hypothetical protein